MPDNSAVIPAKAGTHEHGFVSVHAALLIERGDGWRRW
jgi:hypothetical protein